VTVHPRALLGAAAVLLLAWLAVDVRWLAATAAATVLFDVLSFRGALPASRR
jgi:hypothetical protein